MSYMVGSLLVLSLLILPLALPEFTVSPANLVTARPSELPEFLTRDFGTLRAERALGERKQPTKYSISEVNGKITGKPGGAAVSNCDILEIARDDHVNLDGKLLLMANHL